MNVEHARQTVDFWPLLGSFALIETEAIDETCEMDSGFRRHDEPSEKQEGHGECVSKCNCAFGVLAELSAFSYGSNL